LQRFYVNQLSLALTTLVMSVQSYQNFL